MMVHAHTPPGFSPASKARLTERDIARFPGDSLFDRVARAVCRGRCLPRKELYESWETARRVRRLFRGGRVVDLCAGHGLLAHLMLLLDDTSPDALVVDKVLAPSSARLHEALVQAWPRLAGRIAFVECGVDTVEIAPSDIVVSGHACGGLTDVVINRAIGARARVAVLPCCHHLGVGGGGELGGWLDGSVAIDVARALHLKQHGYRIWTQTIPANITPKNRLLIGAPLTEPDRMAR